jgi:hypothetical protein
MSPLSGNAFADSLVDPGRITYNYELPQKGYIDYTFNTASNLADPGLTLQTMNATQQQDVTTALNYISGVTGITFKQQAGPTADDLVFAYQSSPPNNAGVDYSNYQATEANGSVTGLTLYDTITMNSNNADQINPAPGTDGYLTILHEVGHALGLKHPFSGAVVLPANVDNTNYTVMSYNTVTPYATTYGPVDIAALNYLYGGDGLLGKYGLTVNGAGTPVSNLMPNAYNSLASVPGTNSVVSPNTNSTSDFSSGQTAGLAASETLASAATPGSAGLFGMTTLDTFMSSQGASATRQSGSILAQA